MSSNLEFKYELKRKAQNKNGESNYRGLDSDFDYNSDYRCYGSDYSFDWFDLWSLSFFDSRKRRHYRHLNQSVFKPLNGLELKQNIIWRPLATDYFNYDLVIPSESSKIFQLALKHMKEDEPQLSIEISHLRNIFNRHHKLLENVETRIKNLIEEKLSQTYRSPLKIGSRYSYDFDNVYSFLKVVWESNKYQLKQIENYIDKRASPRIENGYFYFENRPVGRGNNIGFEIMKNMLYDILKDVQLLKGFSDLEESKKNMYNEIEQIHRMTNEIIESIDNDLYETHIKGCCPTVLRIFR